MTMPAVARPIAERVEVLDPPGSPARLTLYGRTGPLAEIVLGPADAVALASDLLLTARLRYGRAPAIREVA